MREIVMDTETTGLNPADGHRILEIGAVEIIHRVATGKIFHALINPEREISEDATRVHGHTTPILRDKPVFSRIVDDFLTFIGDARIVIHNAEFDIGFVNIELARLGRGTIQMDRVVDTLALARKKHPGQPNSLDALCDRYHIDRTQRMKHGALLDAEMLVEIYVELTGGRQHSLSFDVFSDGGEAIRVPHPPLAREGRPLRRLCIFDYEAAAHAEYIKSLGDTAIWFRFATTRG